MANVGDVGAGVRVAEDQVDQAHAATAVAVERFAQARGILGQLLASAQNHHAASAIEALTAAILHGEAAEVAMAETTTRLDEWLVAAGVPRRASGGQEPGSAPAAEPPTRWVPRPSRTAVDEIRPHVGNPIAAGRMYDEHGQPLTTVFGPGEPGPGTGGPGLREPWASMDSVTRHVEGHAAAIMRTRKIKRATVYINMQPCSQRTDPCASRLREALPVGYTLVVVEVRPTGGLRVHTFEGTGEGVQP